jgi:hypothetical protein
MDVLNMFEAMCDIIEPQSALDNDLNMLILNTHAVLTNISNQQLWIIELLQRNREKMIGSNSELLYWLKDESWYYYDDKGIPHLTDSAPERAIKSYEAMNAYYEEYM